MSYHKERFHKGGQPIGGGDRASYVGALEGVSADQDFLKVMFKLTQGAQHQLVCPFCDTIQWCTTTEPLVGQNSPNRLYTCFGQVEKEQQPRGVHT